MDDAYLNKRLSEFGKKSGFGFSYNLILKSLTTI